MAGLALALSAATAAAQPSPDGQLTGVVRDATGAVLAGARVIVESPALVGGRRTLETTRDGTWRLPAVPAGAYSVTIRRDGFREARHDNVAIVAGQTLALDVTLALAGLAEDRRVEAPAPIVDVTSAAIPASLGPDQLRDLPTSLWMADLINLVPGVSGDMAFGGTKLSNGVYVDGVDATEPGEQGPWLRYNQHWLREVQVVGLGADAEHGKSTGVNAYAVVRSGANRYSGLGEYLTTRSQWVADNTRGLAASLQRRFAPLRVRSNWVLNGQLGGPLLANRLWFFAGLEHRVDDRQPAGYAGSDAREEDDTRALAKLTAAVGQRWRLEGFAQGGRLQVRHQGLGPLAPPEATVSVRQPQVSWSARGVAEISPSLLLDLRYTGYDSPQEAAPTGPGSADGPPGHYDLSTGRRSANALTLSRNDRQRQGLMGTLTWFGWSRRGRGHEVKLGIETNRATERTTERYPGGMAYYDLGGAPYLRDRFSGSTGEGTTRQVALFLQDRWRLHDRLTVLPGVRVEAFRGSSPRAGDDALATNPVSPRVGAAWDVAGDHRTVVRVHYGRYTDQVFAQPLVIADSGGEVISERIDAAGTWQEISRRSLASTRRIGTDLRHSHVDQFVAGIERQVGRDVSLQAQYIRRAFGDFLLFVPRGAVWAPVERRDPGPDGVAGTTDDGGAFTVYSLTNPSSVVEIFGNPDDAWRDYDAVQVVARRRLARGWHGQASYTWSRARGTFGPGYHANSGGRGTFGNPNQLINGAGRSPADPTSEVKLLGGWRPAWLGGFTVAGVYRYTTGAAWGRTFVATGLGQGSEAILAEPRGTRRVEAINTLDLRLEKQAPLGGARQAGLVVDVFNVTNQGVPDSDWVVPVLTNSGPSLGLPTAWRAPRMVRVSLRVSF